MGAFLTIVGMLIAMMLFPRLTVAAVLTLFSFTVVETGRLSGVLPGLLFVSGVITLAIQLSPAMGGFVPLLRAKALKWKKFLAYLVSTFITIAIGFFLMMVVGLFLRHVVMQKFETVGFLLILVLAPIIGFVTASIVQRRSELHVHKSEDERDAEKAAARQKAFEEEQQRLAEEREAERQRLAEEGVVAQKRLYLACENMKVVWERVLDTYGGYDGGRLSARGFGIRTASFKSLPYYNRLPLSDLPLVPVYCSASIIDDGPDPAQVWVTNEERLQAIDDILRDTNMLNSSIPFKYSLASVKIPGADDSSRPWLRYIEYTLGLVYPGMTEGCDGELAPIQRYYEGERKAIQAGLDGEEYIRHTLDMHDGEFFVLYDLRLELPGQGGTNESIETDAFVLAPNGLFAIETKNYGSTGKYKIVVTADGQWYKELPGGKRESIPNPVAQNDRHIAFLSKFINDLLGRDMMNRAAIENVIAIANDAVEINVYPGAPLTVTRAGNLYGCIMADRTQKLTLDELQLIKAELEKRALPPKSFPLDDYRERVKWLVRKHDAVCYGSQILSRATREHPDWFANI